MRSGTSIGVNVGTACAGPFDGLAFQGSGVRTVNYDGSFGVVHGDWTISNQVV